MIKTFYIIILYTIFQNLSCMCPSQENEALIKNDSLEVQIAENENIVFQDDFENELQDFWDKETVNNSRFKIVEDPLEKNNKVLQVNLKLEDYSNGGKRSELKIPFHSELNELTRYSFRFMLPENFFRTDEKPGFIIIHQWHDEADPGFNWETQKKVTHPPIYLFIDRKEGGIYNLVFRTGLETGSMNETVTSVWQGELRSNEWYSFSCEILWHIYSHKGYAIPKLNGEYFYDSKNLDDKEPHKIFRRNMYNGIGNYPKIGLYRFVNELYERVIYFDDFIFDSEKMISSK